ncbi:MAG: sortase [Candidatus Kerfeldbacteria bacterium]|jgi:LPXTG-site transpeptidase (sortase) family protein
MKKIGKKYIFTFILVIILIIVGIFIFKSWQDSPTIIQKANINETIFPNNTNSTVALETKEKGEPDYIYIPDVNIKVPIIYITQEENNEEGYQTALENGVVQYPGTAIPGEYGNPYIFGHSSDFFWKEGSYKEIFKPIIDIPLDTIIRITNHEGDLFIYKIIETKIVGPDEVSVLDQQNYERQILTLQTSWPLGTALKRYLVIAELDPKATYKSEE